MTDSEEQEVAKLVSGTWRDVAPDLEFSVGCEGGTHRIRWHSGQIQLLDHSELEAELALVAFGGAEPTCVSRYHLWNDAMADGGFLGEWVDETRLSPSWFSWLAMALDRMRAEGFHEFLRRLPPARAQRMGEFLHCFPPAWLDRAAAGVSEAVVEGDGVSCEFAGPLLSTAVSNRLRRSFVDAVGGRQLSVGAAALVPLRLQVTGSVGADRACVAEGLLIGPERGVVLAVPATWLHRVWAAGASVIDGHLVIDMDPAHGSAQVVRWESVTAGGHRPIVEQRNVRFSAGHWSAAS